jgi:hypothetical protein
MGFKAFDPLTQSTAPVIFDFPFEPAIETLP